MDAAPLSQPIAELIDVLRSARQLLALPENDFAWSSWHSAEDALKEIDGLIHQLATGGILPRNDVGVLFVATGPIQEVSLSSGWAHPFLALAARFDQIEREIWPA